MVISKFPQAVLWHHIICPDQPEDADDVRTVRAESKLSRALGLLICLRVISSRWLLHCAPRGLVSP